ncbi:MAG: AAA family ATPase [Candidatus Bathyarchaeota archaeon]|nr:MAG: AAA family ATPase [Candidatus Bathyarchaeota archaeon]
MRKKLTVLCTGNPGSGRDEYLQRMLTVDNAAQTINYYHLYDYIIQKCETEGYRLNKQTILDFVISNPREIERIRSLAIDEICSEIQDSDCAIHVISTPYSFEWNGTLIFGLTADDIKRLNPQKFIVLIDDITRIRKRLAADAQWREKDFTLVELAKWRRTEIDGTRSIAFSFDPPRDFTLLPVEHDPRVLLMLLLSTVKKIYLSYPITGAQPEEIQKVHLFAKRLTGMYTVFDPLTIQEWALVECWKKERDEANEENKKMPASIECDIRYQSGLMKFQCNSEEIRHAIKDIRHQIVARDYMLIETSDYVVVYHAKKEISVGVVCEMVYGKTHGKLVYAMYPYEPSPFLEYYSHRIFKNEDQFLAFLQRIAS